MDPRRSERQNLGKRPARFATPQEDPKRLRGETATPSDVDMVSPTPGSSSGNTQEDNQADLGSAADRMNSAISRMEAMFTSVMDRLSTSQATAAQSNAATDQERILHDTQQENVRLRAQYTELQKTMRDHLNTLDALPEQNGAVIAPTNVSIAAGSLRNNYVGDEPPRNIPAPTLYTVTGPTTSQAAIHGPKRLIDLPMFSGNTAEWKTFYANYKMSTDQYNYDNTDNAIRLQRCLTGKAREAVSGMLNSAEGIEGAMEILELCFGQPIMVVRNEIANINKIPKLSGEHLEEWAPFAAKMRNLASIVNTPTTQEYNQNPLVIDELVDKIPPHYQMQWSATAGQLDHKPAVQDFADWVMRMARDATRVVTQPASEWQSGSQRRQSTVDRKQGRSSVHLVTQSTRSDQRECALCTERHKLTACQSFIEMDIPTRWEEIRQRRLCFCCLNGGHQVFRCPFRKVCGKSGCTQPHHKLLHENTEDRAANRRTSRSQRDEANRSELAPVSALVIAPADASEEPDDDEESPPAQNSVTLTTARDPNLLLRIVPVKLYGRNTTINTYALLDEGAKLTLIEEKLADELDLAGDWRPVQLSWLGNHSMTEKSRCVDLRISGTRRNAAIFDIHNARTVRNLQLPRQTVTMSKLQHRYKSLKHLPIDDYKNATPQILIGVDHPHLGAPREIIESGSGEVIATHTRLGWLVYGRSYQDFVGVIGDSGTTTAEEKDDLHELVREYYTTENFGVRCTSRRLEATADKRAREILHGTTCRRGDHFQTGLLWASDNVNLPDSRAMAIRRLQSVENKMRKDELYAEQYKKNINDYVQKKYARKLTEEEATKRTPRTWYLPHFGVTNVNKPGKVRLVFDAAAQVDGVSLNSNLLTGPDEYKPLPNVLHQFRLGPVGVSGDIAEMFHQISILPEDQDSQRFVWRHGDPSHAIETYVMQVMTFGARCSPCSAQFVKNQNALEHVHENAAAVKAITDHHYVDDYVMAFQTADEATSVTKAVIDIHQKGGFHIRNFRSNSADVLRSLGCGQAEDPVDLQLEDSPEKILGMYWSTKTDEFSFRLNLHRLDNDVASLKRPPTKRQILSVAMSVFDPFGMLCTIMLYSKLLVQRLWKLKCSWDEPAPTEIVDRWNLWMIELKKINACRLPRCYAPYLLSSSEVQLHIFADASEEAFAAVAYWRVARNDGRYDVSFIAGKTCCAPTKPALTIPRLELQAAVLATRLRTSIVACHHNVRVTGVHLWSDSTTVLCWIASTSRRYKTFVENRVTEILEASAEDEWRYVPTAENVADDATRAPYPPQFEPNGRWLAGPEFLQQEACDWPQRFNRIEATTDEEIRPSESLLVHQTDEPIIDATRFRKFDGLRRVAAMVLRCRDRLTRKEKRVGPLSAQELVEGERVLFRQAQATWFSSERHALQQMKGIKTSSRIYKLLPYLDEDGVMRMTGRVDAAKVLPLDTRRPIILPREDPITALIVDHHHQRMRHQNLDAVVCSVRQRFWVPQLRGLAKKRSSCCQVCKIMAAKPTPPIMGQLPADRVTPHVRPFTYTGLDYFGPIIVTVGRRHEKRWVALFTCLTIRAVHLEVAADLSSDACLLCIRNFMNLRGVPVRIRSDNGTNFVGVDSILYDLTSTLHAPGIADEMASKGVQWVFNSPSHPEAGGCWERMVRCVKRVLAVTVKETAPRVETMRSLLLEAANIVNSRPLTHLPVCSDSEEALTPNHFLLGGSGDTQTPGDVDDRALCSRKQWRVAQQLKNRFWRRWIHEYLPELTRRARWYVDTNPVKVGDLVMIVDENVTYGRWRRGRITQIFPGPDGRVRNAVVRTADRELRRPVSRLAVLDVGETA